MVIANFKLSRFIENIVFVASNHAFLERLGILLYNTFYPMGAIRNRSIKSRGKHAGFALLLTIIPLSFLVTILVYLR